MVRGIFGTPVVVGGGTSWSTYCLVWFGPAIRLPILGAYGRAVRRLVLYWSWSRSHEVLSLGCDAA